MCAEKSWSWVSDRTAASAEQWLASSLSCLPSRSAHFRRWTSPRRWPPGSAGVSPWAKILTQSSTTFKIMKQRVNDNRRSRNASLVSCTDLAALLWTRWQRSLSWWYISNFSIVGCTSGSTTLAQDGSTIFVTSRILSTINARHQSSVKIMPTSCNACLRLCSSFFLSFFLSLSLSSLLLLCSMTMTMIARTHGPDLPWVPGPLLVGRTCSHHARDICLGIPVQTSCHLEWSGPVSVLEGRMCLVWCGVVDCRQTWRHDLATFKRVMVTLAVYPRLFGIPTTLTCRALGRNHVVSTPFETIVKKGVIIETRKARCTCAISNLSRIVKNTTAVRLEVRQCWCRCVGCCVVKKKKKKNETFTSMTVPKRQTRYL